jgi:hypothetical protein
MRYARIFLVAILVLIGLSGCTSAWFEARGACQKLSESKFPKNFHTTTENRIRYEKVPDGLIQCVSGYCSQGTRTIEIPYTQRVTVDLNKTTRQDWSASCTKQKCNDGGTRDKVCSGRVWSAND